MASPPFTASTKAAVFLIVLFFFFTSSLLCRPSTAAEFVVNGNDGWVVPPSDNHQIYNDWASKHRFKVNDTLHFEYKKDSVMEVTEQEYEKCLTSGPLFFSNNGSTIFVLDGPGLFYFISGIMGHCDRGQKMIVKVLEPKAQSGNDTSHDEGEGGAANNMAAAVGFPGVLLLLISPFLVVFPL
ncbi:hypothetical protein Nepgr_018932 [Nepenthes gracilis]|uniref:Phytocyanin domain-containing protein n=1 Tax=Nepenthes gracilis TaxID=150966 RepID=A0AAD3SW11_NEPGR|nr:hypothetical protein Nepgr_018932 [Nepenthes gracilis]